MAHNIHIITSLIIASAQVVSLYTRLDGQMLAELSVTGDKLQFY